MRVLLINCNEFSFSQLPREMEKQRGLNPPISLAYVAAAIKLKGHYVEILDLDIENPPKMEFLKKIHSFQPEIVGFSVMISNFINILKISQWIKEDNQKVNIVYGGIMVNLFPEKIIKYSVVDIGVCGEGEIIFPEILDHLENKRDLQNIKGIIYKKDGKIITTEPADIIMNLDEIPFPARELLDNDAYTSLISHNSPITILFTSRGCPYNCVFCSKPSFWEKWRYASPEYVVREFKECIQLGIKEILVYDDVFTSDKKRVIEICQKLINEKINITWDIRTRVDMIDEEILFWLKKAGCSRINFGVESGDPEILKTLKKGYSFLQIMNAFNLSKKFGFETLAYFMIGSPGETKKSIKNTYNLMKSLNPDYVHISHVVPYPNTKLFQIAVEQKYTVEDIWDNPDNYTYEKFPMFATEELNREKIFRFVKKGYRIFYYRPKYVFNRLKKIKSLSEFWRNVKAAFSLK